MKIILRASTNRRLIASLSGWRCCVSKRSYWIAAKKHLWTFYVKLSDFEAQCMFCESKHRYLKDTTFREHIATHHIKIWTYEEERKLTRWPWRYFKYLDNIYSQCIICDANVPSTTESVENHLSLHSLEQLENSIYRGWSWKYCTRRDDFEVECKICHKILSLTINYHLHRHILKTHLNKLKEVQETHETVGSSKRDLSLQTDHKASKSLNIVTKKQVWKYFVKLPDFRAQCMLCKNKYCYVNDAAFRMHLLRNHVEIWKHEEERKLIKWPWMHFKYLDNIYSQCIICNANILSTLKSVENHLNLHSKEQQKNFFSSWSRKYYTQKDDFVVECNICNTNVLLNIQSRLNFHVKDKHLNKLKIKQETIDSSKHVLSLQTNSSISQTISIASQKQIWKYYLKLPDFKAQCIFCKYRTCYINYSNFMQHIKRMHEKIWIYEEERKLKKRLWMHFKYLDNMYSQCVICDANVPSTSESAENHLNLHSEKQQENILCSWQCKYYTQKDDFIVECNICNNDISLSIRCNVNYHINALHSNKLKNTQETHDTADLSKCVLSSEINTTSKLILLLKDCYVLLKKCPHSNYYE